MAQARQPRIIFITGTDTGVGKTVLTSLLLAHLRQGSSSALAIKPFCAGGREDAELLHSLQQGDLTLDQINPFHFAEPLAPLVAARKHRRFISLNDARSHINAVASLCPPPDKKKPSFLLIEGAGGLLAPLGPGYSLLDLIVRLRGEVLIAAANKLGTINHTFLTIQALRAAGISTNVKVVLMDTVPARSADSSTASNARVLRELFTPTPLLTIPYLGSNCSRPPAVRKHATKLKHTLARIAAA